MHTSRSAAPLETNANFGGFPGPREVISRLIRRFLPALHRRLTRTITMPRTTTMRGNMDNARVAVPYLSFDATVGPNSTFEELTEEQLEELGGVEFRALSALLWIVGIVRLKYCLYATGLIHLSAQYHICVQLVSFTIIAPYISTNKWKNDFIPPQQKRPVIPAWYVSSKQRSSKLSSPPLLGFQFFRSCLRIRTRECPLSTSLWCPFKGPIL